MKKADREIWGNFSLSSGWISRLSSLTSEISILRWNCVTVRVSAENKMVGFESSGYNKAIEILSRGW